jgi:hypothetical protein
LQHHGHGCWAAVMTLLRGKRHRGNFYAPGEP